MSQPLVFKISIRLSLALVVLVSTLVSTAKTASAKTVSKATQQQVRKSLTPGSQKSIIVAGGTWTGSGGDGVACFKDQKEASHAIDEAGKIKPEYRSKIERLFALDTWEYQNEYLFMAPMKNEDPVQYIVRAIDKHLSQDMPYFAEKLKKTIKILSTNEWKSHWSDQGALPLILDQGSIGRSIPEQCRLVQLAVRYAHSSTGKIPEVFIDVDGDLIERMKNGPSWSDNILFTGTLLLHEAIWMSGVELNMPDSAASRKLTAAILSENVAAAIAERPEHLREKLWTNYLYTLGFRDYFSLFLGEEKASVDPTTPSSKASRRAARAHIARLYQKTLQQLRLSEYGPMDEATERAFIHQLVLTMTPEETFLFVAASLHNTQKIPFNIDIFYLDGLDDRAHVHFSCGIINTYLRFEKEGGDDNNNPSFSEAMEKALLYCKTERGTTPR